MTNTLTHTVGTAGRLAILSRDELERLDAAALEVLAEVGVSIPSEKARAALGARAAAPVVTGERSLVTTDGCCVEIYDLESGEKRGTTANDVATISRVVDAMPEIDFCWPAVSAQDRPADVRGLH